MKAVNAGLVILGVSLLAAMPAWSHAMPHQTTPKAGAVLKSPPQAVSILFDEEIQPGASRIEVLEGAHVVSVGKAAQDPKQPRLLKVALRHPAKGKYTVKWHALAQDGHPSMGSFAFSVK